MNWWLIALAGIYLVIGFAVLVNSPASLILYAIWTDKKLRSSELRVVLTIFVFIILVVLLWLPLVIYFIAINNDTPKKIIRKECTKDKPFSGERKENEIWTHVDADWTDDDFGRFLKCPNCGIIIDLGPDV